MTRTTPVLLRRTALAGLTAFWCAVALVVAVLLSWSTAVVVTLATVEAGLLVVTLVLALRSASRMRTPRASTTRHLASGKRLPNAT